MILAITAAVHYTKTMYCPGVCIVPVYVLSRRMYRPDICTVRVYVPSINKVNKGTRIGNGESFVNILAKCQFTLCVEL